MPLQPLSPEDLAKARAVLSDRVEACRTLTGRVRTFAEDRRWDARFEAWEADGERLDVENNAYAPADPWGLAPNPPTMAAPLVALSESVWIRPHYIPAGDVTV